VSYLENSEGSASQPERSKSNVKFTDEQIELMSNDIGEILSRLKDKQVIDFDKSIPIVLLDRHSISVEFKRTDILEIKRFTSLVLQHLPALTYLCRHLTFRNETRDVIRNDRIMGSINYAQTMKIRQSSAEYEKTVVCQEILRDYNTPENTLLTLILFSIVVYSDKCLSLEALVESRDKLDVTIAQLREIRSKVSYLLSTRIIKDILPNSMDSLPTVNQLFAAMKNRIELGKIPSYYANIHRLFEKWKNYFWVALDDKTILKHVLRYHFMKLEDENDMYECWMFCKTLYALSEVFDLKLSEVSSKLGKNVFVSRDNRIKIIYQARYETHWQKEDDDFIEDVPDVALELHNGIRLILDAKNSYYRFLEVPYLRQIQSYIISAKANFGIVIHSATEGDSSWHKVKDRKNNVEIIWTAMSPDIGDKPNEGLDRIIELIRSSM
jgi:hypothetical protein